ncbi:MAG: adenylate/guanylate cyclase domain-containing protein [Leptospiraceae bacterium]|nr:adenylate/guanylate cyclase domain-containing protein [Leptospiraceae bacterium]MCP5499617.1 adenylate/guanylate cyclase domain-containing protein [Leptospiraceae bacterium]
MQKNIAFRVNTDTCIFMMTILSLQEFLKLFPNPSILDTPSRLDYFWHLELNCSAEKLWPEIIDTSKTNKLLELPEMQFKEKGGKLYGKTKNVGIELEWEEVPWQWEYKRFIENSRKYTKGFAKYVRVVGYLQELGNNSLRLYFYFAWLPANLRGKLLLRMAMPRMEKKYRVVFKNIANSLQVKSQIKIKTEKVQLEEGGKRILENAKVSLMKLFPNEVFVQNFLEHLEYGTEEELYRLRVKELALRWQEEEREVLKLFLQATRLGVLQMSWDVVCPHCRGVREELKHLGEVPPNASCEVCEIDFRTGGMDILEITFHIHPSIRKVAKRFYCSAEPSKKSHIILQKAFTANEKFRISCDFLPGLYRMRTNTRKEYNYMQVKEDADSKLRELTLEELMSKREFVIFQKENLGLWNHSDSDNVLILEKTEPDTFALRPKDLFLLQDFHDIFSEEAIQIGVSLDVGVQTILFTDLVGSTKLYSELGDGQAFSRVKQHFVWIYEEVTKHQGALTKTIGDAAMLVFPSPELAMRAAFEMQKRFHEKNDLGLRIRISLHSGPCLSVNLNSNIDFFGNTVNLCSKIQSLCGAGEIVFTETVKKNIEEFLYTRNLKLEELVYERNWDKERLKVFKIKVS